MKKIIYILSALVVSFGACTSPDDGVDINSVGGIGFSVGSLSGSYTRVEIITEKNQTEYFTDFGVYAFEQTSPINYTESPLMDRQKVSYDKSYSKWIYSDFVKWPSSGLGAEFFAYAPYEDDTFTTNMNDDAQLELHYTHPSHVDDHVDIMVADYVNQTDTYSNVPLTFNHQFAAIAFKIYGMGEVAVTSVGFKGGYESGIIKMDSTGCVWSDCVFNADRVFGLTFDTEEASIEEPIITAERGDYMMMIPLEKVASSDMYITYINGNGDSREATIYSDEVVSWESNKIYTYTLTLIDDSAEVDVELGNIVFGLYVDIESWDSGIVSEEQEELLSESDPSFIDNRSEVSNCYMFDSSLGDQVYYIPVDERIYEFWAGYQGYSGETLTNYTLAETDEWYPDIIWYTGDIYGLSNDETISGVTDYGYCNLIGDDDTQIKFERLDPESEEYINLMRNEKVTAQDCTTNFVTKNAKAIMKITLPCKTMGIDDANIFVAVKKMIGTTQTILWSWHFWITDYNPNTSAPQSTDIEGNFEVQNGHVHQYKDSSTQTSAVWGSRGIYSEKYMMDRNVGMFAENKTYAAYGDLLYYQYGRKDPFPYNNSLYYTMGANFSSLSFTALSSTNYSNYTMKTAVQSPTVRYRSNYTYPWLSDDVASSTTCLWNDVNIPYTFITDITQDQKSMFDPSPLGWKLPVYEAWSGIISDINSGTNVDYVAVALSSSPDHGTSFIYGGYVYIPTCGYYTISSMSTPSSVITSASADATIYMWTSSPYSSKYSGRCLNIEVDPDTTTGVHGIDIDDSYCNRNISTPVRCVQE